MKAKEYAKMFDGTSTSLVHIATLFVREMGDIGLRRNIASPSCARALLAEMENKWRVFIELTGAKLRPDGFRLLLKAAAPDYYAKLGVGDETIQND